MSFNSNDTYNTPDYADVSDFNNVTEDLKKYDTPSWHEIFNGAQAAMTAIGFILNIFTIITLQVNGKGFSPVIRYLLLHQAVADSLVCICGILIIAVPPLALVGDNTLSLLICQAWHTQGIYWSFIYVSIANLEVIAAERFIVICFPFKHAELSKSFFKCVTVLLYPMGVMFNIIGYLQLRYEKGVCLQEYYWDTPTFRRMMQGHAIWGFLMWYIIPCALFAVLYGGIVFMLYARQRQSNLAQSNVIDAATKQMTKTAMVVTGWFIVAMGYDLWYYVLGHNGVVVYLKGTIIQKVGIFLSASNSCVNPVIYVMFMPTFRKSCISTLMCQREAKPGLYSATASTAISMSTVNDKNN